MITVRIPKRLAQRWVAKPRTDGFDAYKLSHFVETGCLLGSFARVVDDLLLMTT